jgi:chemotaxis methyl-accepting protein methylase
VKSIVDEDLTSLITMVREDRGIDLSNYKDKYLRRRIGVRVRASGAHNLHHYMKLLRQDPAEYRFFLDAMTINTSNFFRNQDCFRCIEEEVMPEVARMAASIPSRPPFIWSAACARGEEAYSLAILAARHESLSGAARPPILATDIDESALESARRGEYTDRDMGETPCPDLEGGLDREGEQVRVPAPLRDLVTFARHDILRDPLPGRFFLILCRNLLIYLERGAQETLMARLAEALRPGGYLILGKSEMLVGATRGRLTAVSPAERIYRKPPRSGSLPAPVVDARRKA